MLQRYPELAKKVDLLVSIVGFMHKSDLVFKPSRLKVYKFIARVLATRPVGMFIRYCMFNRSVLKIMYRVMPWSRIRMIEVTPDEFNQSIEFEIKLWRVNSVRTHWLTTSEFLDLNNCQQFVGLPVVHIVSEGDHYLNNLKVEQHMRQVFSDYRQFTAKTKAHVPSVLADKKAMAVLLPQGLRKLLSQESGSA
jgi:hypothetical protein